MVSLQPNGSPKTSTKVPITYYFKDVLSGKTKPHAFSWLIWGILAANGFIAQVHARAGFGAWVTGLTAVASIAICCLALRNNNIKPTRLDWTLLVMSLLGFISLFVINNKLLALLITIFALIAGFVITLRKVYAKPQEETAKSFMLNAFKFVLSFFALSSFSFLTLGYLITALLGNAAIALMIYVRRKQLR